MPCEEWETVYLQLLRIVVNPKKLEKILDGWNLDRNSRIVDLCCGNGECFQVFSKARYRHLVGIDYSFNLLSGVKAEVPLIRGDANQCPIKDNAFDVVFINKALHHFLDYSRLLAEIKRILSPGGYFCFIEPRSTWFRKLSHAVLLSSPLGVIFPRYRKIKAAMLAEGETYFSWLNNSRAFFKMLEEQHGFSIESIRKDLVHYAVKCRNNK